MSVMNKNKDSVRRGFDLIENSNMPLQEYFPVGYAFRPRTAFSRGLAPQAEPILFDGIQMAESRVLRVTALPPRVDNQLVFDVEYSCVSCDGSGVVRIPEEQWVEMQAAPRKNYSCRKCR
jgi:hypothetical protein